MNRLDHLGIPGVMVVTEALKPAAAAQSRSLGFQPNIIWVGHPIQNRTKDELRALANQAGLAILALFQTAA